MVGISTCQLNLLAPRKPQFRVDSFNPEFDRFTLASA
jgi:hypothetical protein